jgi:hypothetical protein
LWVGKRRGRRRKKKKSVCNCKRERWFSRNTFSTWNSVDSATSDSTTMNKVDYRIHENHVNLQISEEEVLLIFRLLNNDNLITQL